ncbi:Cro/CI family transcriptional regulator [Enterovibrio sp. Hal110]
MHKLFQTLLTHFGTQEHIAKAFGVSRQAVYGWKTHVPERIALLCHLSKSIPYKYNPNDYETDGKGLSLYLEMPQMSPEPTQPEVDPNDKPVHSEAA